MNQTKMELTFISLLQDRFDLNDHKVDHSVRVSSLAKAFAQQEGIGSQADLVAVAALLHELCNYDRDKVYNTLSDVLAKYGYPESEIATVLSWILDAKTRDSALHSLSASIVWDANLIDDLGATGLAARFLKVYTSSDSFEAVMDDIQTREIYVTDNVITQTGQAYTVDRGTFVKEYIERFRMEVRGDV